MSPIPVVRSFAKSHGADRILTRIPALSVAPASFLPVLVQVERGHEDRRDELFRRTAACPESLVHSSPYFHVRS